MSPKMRYRLMLASIWINEHTGGEKGQTLCTRIALRFGPYCLFCRIMDVFTEPGHCRRDLFDWNYRR